MNCFVKNDFMIVCEPCFANFILHNILQFRETAKQTQQHKDREMSSSQTDTKLIDFGGESAKEVALYQEKSF
jgi:hypothetical protein